jgi:putative hydrolase of the HAD superfamily
MKTATKVIFFDAGGTLFRPYPSVGAVYSLVAARHGVKADPEVVEKAFHQHWHSRNGLSTLSGLTSEKIERDWWRQMVMDVFTTPFAVPAESGGGTPTDGIGGDSRMPFKDFDAFFQELYDLFARAECWRLFDETVSTLETLRGQGYRLAIISNWDHRLFSIVEQLGLSEFFDQVIASSAVGVAKPGKRIFEAALKAMNALPEESLHIGDSIEDDYHGATRAGMKAVFLDRHKPNAGVGRRESGEGKRPFLIKVSSSRTPRPASRVRYNDVLAVHSLSDLIPLLNGPNNPHQAQS